MFCKLWIPVLHLSLQHKVCVSWIMLRVATTFNLFYVFAAADRIKSIDINMTNIYFPFLFLMLTFLSNVHMRSPHIQLLLWTTWCVLLVRTRAVPPSLRCFHQSSQADL